MSSKQRERDEFVAQLAHELPGHTAGAIAELAATLIVKAGAYKRLQEEQCNRGLTEHEERREKRLEAQISELLRVLNMRAVFNGDPRGYTVRIILPSGRSNTWANDGWGVPNS